MDGKDDARQAVPEDMQDYLQRMGAVLAEMESQHKQSNAPRRESLARATALYYERKHRSAPGDSAGTSAGGSAASSAVSSGASSPAALVRALSSPGGTRRSNAGGMTPPQRRLEHSASSPATGRRSTAGSPRATTAQPLSPKRAAAEAAVGQQQQQQQQEEEEGEEAPAADAEQAPESRVTRRTLTWVSPSKQQQRGRPPLHHQPPASSPVRVRHLGSFPASRPGASPLRVSSSGSLHGTSAAHSPRRNGGSTGRSGDATLPPSGAVSEAEGPDPEAPAKAIPPVAAAEAGEQQEAATGSAAGSADQLEHSQPALESPRGDGEPALLLGGLEQQDEGEDDRQGDERQVEQQEVEDQASEWEEQEEEKAPPQQQQQQQQQALDPHSGEQRLRAREAYVNAEVSVLTDALLDDAVSESLMQGTTLDEEGTCDLGSDGDDGASDGSSEGQAAECLPRVGSPESDQRGATAAEEEEAGGAAAEETLDTVPPQAATAPDTAAAVTVSSEQPTAQGSSEAPAASGDGAPSCSASPEASPPQSPSQPDGPSPQEASPEAPVARGWVPAVSDLGPGELAELSASPQLSRRTSRDASAGRGSADEDLPITQLSQVLKLRRSGSGALPLSGSGGRSSPWRASAGALRSSSGSPAPFAAGPLARAPSSSMPEPAAERTDSPDAPSAKSPTAAAAMEVAGSSPECPTSAHGSPERPARPTATAAAAAGGPPHGALSPIPSCGDDTVLFGSPSGSPAASTASGLVAARRALSAGRRPLLRDAGAGQLQQAAAAAAANEAAAVTGRAATAMGLVLGCSCEALPGVPSALDTPPGAAPVGSDAGVKQQWADADGSALSDGEDGAVRQREQAAALPPPMWQQQMRQQVVTQQLSEEVSQQQTEEEGEEAVQQPELQQRVTEQSWPEFTMASEGHLATSGHSLDATSDSASPSAAPAAENSTQQQAVAARSPDAAASASPSSSAATVPLDASLSPPAAPWVAQLAATSLEPFAPSAGALWSPLSSAAAPFAAASAGMANPAAAGSAAGAAAAEEAPEDIGTVDEETCSLDGLSDTSSGSVGIEEELQLQRRLLEEQARIHAAGLLLGGAGTEVPEEHLEAEEDREARLERLADAARMIDSTLIQSAVAAPTSLAPPHFLEAAAVLGGRRPARSLSSGAGDDALQSSGCPAELPTQQQLGSLATGLWSPVGSAVSTGGAAYGGGSPTKAALSRMMRQLGSALSCASQPSVQYNWEFDEAAAAAAEAASAAVSATASAAAASSSSVWGEAAASVAAAAAMRTSVDGPAGVPLAEQNGQPGLESHYEVQQQQQTVGPAGAASQELEERPLWMGQRPSQQQLSRQQSQEAPASQQREQSFVFALSPAVAPAAAASAVGATARLICCAFAGLALAAVEGAPPPHLIACGPDFVIHAPTLLAVSAVVAATSNDSGANSALPPPLTELVAAAAAAGAVIAAATGAALLIVPPLGPPVTRSSGAAAAVRRSDTLEAGEFTDSAADQITEITDQITDGDLETEGEQYSESPLPAESRLAPPVTGVTGDLDRLPSVTAVMPPGDLSIYAGAVRSDAGGADSAIDGSESRDTLPPLLADVSRAALAPPTAAEYDVRRYTPGADLEGNAGPTLVQAEASHAAAAHAGDKGERHEESDLDSLTSLSEDLEEEEGEVEEEEEAIVPAQAAWRPSAAGGGVAPGVAAVAPHQMGRPSPRELDSWLVVPAPPPPQRRWSQQRQQQQLEELEDEQAGRLHLQQEQQPHEQEQLAKAEQYSPPMQKQPSKQHSLASAHSLEVTAVRQPSGGSGVGDASSTAAPPLTVTASADQPLLSSDAEDGGTNNAGSPGSRGLFAALRALKHRHRGSGGSSGGGGTAAPAPAAPAALAAAGYGGALGHGAAGECEEPPAPVSRWDWRAPLGSRRGSRNGAGEAPAVAVAVEQQQSQEEEAPREPLLEDQQQQERQQQERQERQPSGPPLEPPQPPADGSTQDRAPPQPPADSGAAAAASAARRAALAKLKQDVLRRQQMVRASYQPLAPPPQPTQQQQEEEEQEEGVAAEAPLPQPPATRPSHALRGGGLMSPARRLGPRPAAGPVRTEQEEVEQEAPTPPPQQQQQQQPGSSGAKPYLKRSTRTVTGNRIDWSNVQARTTSRLDENYILPKSSAPRRGGGSGSGSYARSGPAWRGGAGEPPASAPTPPPRRREGGAAEGRAGSRGSGGAGLMGAGGAYSSGRMAPAGYAVEYHGTSPYGFRDVGLSSSGGSTAGPRGRGAAAGGGAGGRRTSTADAFNSTDVSATRKSTFAVAGGSTSGYGGSPRKPASAPARGGGGSGGMGGRFMYGGGQSSGGGASTSGGGATGGGFGTGGGLTSDSPLDDILSHVSSLLQDFDRTFGVHTGGES